MPILAEILWESRKKEKCYGNGKAVNLYSGHGDFKGIRDRPGSRGTGGKLNLDSEIGVWMQGAAPSALIFMLTIFPGLKAGATLCRRFAPVDVICSVWGEIRTHGSSDVEPRRGDRK